MQYLSVISDRLGSESHDAAEANPEPNEYSGPSTAARPVNERLQ